MGRRLPPSVGSWAGTPHAVAIKALITPPVPVPGTCRSQLRLLLGAAPRRRGDSCRTGSAAAGCFVRGSMSRLGEMRALRRDPAGREPLPGIGMSAAGVASCGAATGAKSHGLGSGPTDPSGHTFSPTLRAQQREVNAKFLEAPTLASKAKAEFDGAYLSGFERRQAGDPAGALERFASAYVLAREMNYRAGEADALNMTGVCYKEKGDVAQAVSVFEGCATLCSGLKDAPGEAAALGNLGQALTAQGQLVEAEAAHMRSLKLARSASDLNGALDPSPSPSPSPLPSPSPSPWHSHSSSPVASPLSLFASRLERCSPVYTTHSTRLVRSPNVCSASPNTTSTTASRSDRRPSAVRANAVRPLPFVVSIRPALSEHVSGVRPSTRLRPSPRCLFMTPNCTPWYRVVGKNVPRCGRVQRSRCSSLGSATGGFVASWRDWEHKRC